MKRTKTCWLEIFWNGKWRWAGTFCNNTWRQCFDDARDAAKGNYEEEPEDWRVHMGEPKETDTQCPRVNSPPE